MLGSLFFLITAVHAVSADDVARLETQIELLDEVSMQSPDFFPALELEQKLFYRLERWDRLFAQAQFYRARFLSTPEDQAKYFRESMVALEILALTKHCAWQEAEQLITQSTAIAQRLHVNFDQITRAKNLMALHRYFPKEGIPSQWTAIPSTAFTDLRHWRVEPEALQRVAHPRVLRVLVEDACPKGAS